MPNELDSNDRLGYRATAGSLAEHKGLKACALADLWWCTGIVTARKCYTIIW